MREAAELASASVEVMRAIDHRWGVARAQLGLGDLARLRGDLAGASACTRTRWLPAGDQRAAGDRALPVRSRPGGDSSWATIEAAREHLTESLRLSRDIGTHIGMARGLESFAALAAREDEPERAVLLAAAAAALRATSGLPPLPGARAERYLAAARRLGEGRRAVLWARGLELSPAAAIDLALEHAGRAGDGGGQSAAPPSALAASARPRRRAR